LLQLQGELLDQASKREAEAALVDLFTSYIVVARYLTIGSGSLAHAFSPRFAPWSDQNFFRLIHDFAPQELVKRTVRLQ
jgi:hypothetical protein